MFAASAAGLPHESDRLGFATLGYSTVRQGPNGLIHILSTMTHPCLHYTINEAWLLTGGRQQATKAPVVAPAVRTQLTAATGSGGKASWSALVGGSAGYVLDGPFAAVRADGTPEYNASYANGTVLEQTYFDTTDLDYRAVWSWVHLPSGTSTFTRYWAGGPMGAPPMVAARSSWSNRPAARDQALIKTNPKGLTFVGLSADGPACLFACTVDQAAQAAPCPVAAASMFKMGVLDPTQKAAAAAACAKV